MGSSDWQASQVLLLSTCGTSLLGHCAPADRAWLQKHANARDIDPARLAELRRQCDDHLEAAGPVAYKLSAELSSIAAVRRRWPKARIQHLLVHTDTDLGELAAELVAQVLEAAGDVVEPVTAGGLRTDDRRDFRAALALLTQRIEVRTEDWRRSGSPVLFNLTGGFKSLNSYLQTLGMLLADRCLFLFEGATELMEIPRLPIRFDAAAVVREHFRVFRRLAHGYPVSVAEAQGVPESLLMEVDGVVDLNEWGQVVWGRASVVLYVEALPQPLSPSVVVADAVRRAFDKLESEEKRKVVDALDAFSLYHDFPKRSPLLKSHTFKKLAGDPVPGSTHELYAWSDGAAGRLFGHYEDGGVFVFDALRTHL